MMLNPAVCVNITNLLRNAFEDIQDLGYNMEDLNGTLLKDIVRGLYSLSYDVTSLSLLVAMSERDVKEIVGEE